jgi:hypothetical protein
MDVMMSLPGIKGFTNWVSRLSQRDLFRLERITAPPTYNRWLLVIPSVATHLCLGAVFAWTLYNDVLILENGVVVSAASDWTFGWLMPIFSTVLGIHGISAALLGKWQEETGPRLSGVLGAIFYSAGFLVGGVGVLLHALPLVYLGYGLLAGIGMGLAYVPPVAALIRWFPDKRGMATGLTIMGFGGGALVTSPIIQYLFKTFRKAPEYLGSADSINLITTNGRQYVEIAGELTEVVVATASDIAKSFPGLPEGVYVVGTGSTGAGLTLLVIGASYFVVMLASALSYRVAPKGYVPAGWTPPKQNNMFVSQAKSVHIDDVMKTPQFWQIWIAFASLSTAGMGVIAISKTMMHEIFSKNLPALVTTAFTANYVMAISAANLLGRIGWSSVSDYIGRKRMFTVFFLTCIPLFLLLPYTAYSVTVSPSVFPLVLFYSSTLVFYSMFGAGYSTVPAYEADLFGQKYCGAIHGRMLTASALASIVGPNAVTFFRGITEKNAIKDLVAKIDPTTFLNKFGAPVSELDILINTKTVTINKLMQIVPPGTVDPTPFLYNSFLYSFVALLAVGFIANQTVRPVDQRFFREEPPTVIKELPPSPK